MKNEMSHVNVLFNAPDGKNLLTEIAAKKAFSTGSKGFHFSGKMVNPETGERYQVSCSIVLIGSKPGKK